MTQVTRIVKTIRFPADVLEAVRPFTGKNKVNFSSFVIEALRNYVRVLKYREGIEKSFASWKTEDHPELEDGTGSYTRKMREGRQF